MIHTLFIFLWTICATTVLGITTILVSFFDSSGNAPHKVARLWAKSIIYASFIKVKLSGLPNINPDSTYIYMSNHQGNYDIPALLGFLPVQFRWLAKAGLFKVPIMGWGMKSVGYIPINRFDRNSAIQSISKAARSIKKGASVMIFPEGTRSKDGKLKKFKKGGFFLAIDSGIPIVPIIINGSMEIMPKGKFFIKPGIIKVQILKPIDTSNYTRETKDELLNNVHTIMKDCL